MRSDTSRACTLNHFRAASFRAGMVVPVVYVVAAGILVLARELGTIPDQIVNAATIVAWIGTIAAVLSDCGLLFAILTVSMTPLSHLKDDVEEGEVGVLWWWTPVFAGLLLLSDVISLAVVASVAAVFKWPLSAAFIRAACNRLSRA